MTDLDMFQQVLAQMHQGQGYYDAMGDALRHGPGPAGSLFHWRPPLLYLLLSWLPFRVPVWMTLAEIWAGLAIAGSSLTAQSAKRTSIGLACLAVLFRELAVPYFVVRAVMGRRDWIGWTLAANLIILYYGLHWSLVHAAQLPTDTMGPSWLTFKGLPFLLATFPSGFEWFWLVGLIFAISVPGASQADRIAMAGYALAFLCLGQYDPPRYTNAYWGYQLLPLQAIGMWQGLIWVTDGTARLRLRSGRDRVSARTAAVHVRRERHWLDRRPSLSALSRRSGPTR